MPDTRLDRGAEEARPGWHRVCVACERAASSDHVRQWPLVRKAMQEALALAERERIYATSAPDPELFRALRASARRFLHEPNPQVRECWALLVRVTAGELRALGYPRPRPAEDWRDRIAG